MKEIDLFGDEIPAIKALDKRFLFKAISALLRDISLDNFVSLITNEVEECVEYYRLANGENSCQKTSLLFNPHRLDTKTKHSKCSIYNALRNETFLDGLCRALAFQYKDSRCSTKDLLYQTLRFGINGIQYVNEFPPKVARDLCLKYGVKKNDKVLDPCAGWGGRMLGVSVVSDCYRSFEPSTKTYNGLNKLYDWIRNFNPDFRAEIECKPFEDSTLDKDSFDFAITSPPYYDTEEYCEDHTNSLNRYKNFDSWCDGFFLPMIEKTMNALKYGKAFILNIGSRIYPLNEILLSNFSIKYEIRIENKYLSGSGGGLKNKQKEGEQFFAIMK